MNSALRLLSLASFACLTAAAPAFAKVTETFTQTYPLDAHGVISLENVNGSVEIEAWDKNEVALEAEKSARNEDSLARIQLRIDASARRLSIKTEFEKQWKLWETANAQVHYKLKVPAGVSLEKIDVMNANIRVTGVKGPVNLDTVNGSIEATELSGQGTFDTTNGSINVSYRTMPQAKIVLDTTNGSCRITLPADAAFQLDASTVNGRITCDFPITLEGSSKRRVRGPVNGGGFTVQLESVNGGLTVAKGK